MLKLIVSALVAGSFPVVALAQVNESPEAASPAAETAESSRGVRAPIFVDRGYFLPRGQFGLELGVGLSSSIMKTENSLLVEREYQITGSELKANLTYGILNDLNVFMGTAYVPNYQSEEQTTSVKTTSKGMDEPKFGIVYRVLNQSESMPFDMLLGFVYSPKGAVAKFATTDDDGNAAQGGDSKSLVLGFFRRVSAGEFGLRLSYEAMGETESEDATSGDKGTGNARGITTLNGTAQFEASEKFYVMAGVGFSRVAEAKSTDVTSGDVTTTEAYVIPTFSGGLRIIAIPKKAYVDLGINVAVAQDIEVTSTTGINGKINSLATTQLTAAVQIEF